MANKYYELITETELEIDGKVYQVQNFNLSLKDFLDHYSDKKLYIYRPSIETNRIMGIVI